jgi:hypothetical protein
MSKVKLSAAELRQQLAIVEAEERTEKLKKEKAFKKRKEGFVNETVGIFKDLQSSLIDLKTTSVTEGNRLWEQMFALEDQKPKEQKQFSLMNNDKTRKIVVDRAERFGFNEEAIVGIQGVKEFFKAKFANRSKLAYSILDKLLIKNGAGDYDPKLLSKLRSEVKEINDPELTKSFAIIENNQVVVGTALSFRAYEKDEKGKWKDIVVQFSSL